MAGHRDAPSSQQQQQQRDGGDEDGVDLKEVDGLLSEMSMMLAKWSLYGGFLADKCRVSRLLRLRLCLRLGFCFLWFVRLTTVMW